MKNKRETQNIKEPFTHSFQTVILAISFTAIIALLTLKFLPNPLARNNLKNGTPSTVLKISKPKPPQSQPEATIKIPTLSFQKAEPSHQKSENDPNQDKALPFANNQNLRSMYDMNKVLSQFTESAKKNSIPHPASPAKPLSYHDTDQIVEHIENQMTLAKVPLLPEQSAQLREIIDRHGIQTGVFTGTQPNSSDEINKLFDQRQNTCQNIVRDASSFLNQSQNSVLAAFFENQINTNEAGMQITHQLNQSIRLGK